MAKRGRGASPNGRTVGERYTRLPHYLQDCPAWRLMSPNASKLLLAVWRRHNGSNNGEISFSVREAEAIGFSKDQTSRAFKELVSKGFLKVRTDSAFTCKLRLARTWEITAEACDDRPPSKDFMRWQADGERKPGGET